MTHNEKLGRNQPCPICGMKMKNCQGHEKQFKRIYSHYWKIGFAIILLVVSIAGYKAFFPDRKATQELSDFGVKMSFSKDMMNIKKLSKEEANFLYQMIIMPALGYVVDNYPIIPIREKFKAVMEDIGIGRRVQICPTNEETSAFCSAIKTRDDQPLLLFHMCAWTNYMDRLDEECLEEIARQRFEDKLVESILHEYYHLTRQQYWKRFDLSPAELLDSEAECWAYTCEEVIGPMIRAGRGPVYPELDYGLNYWYHKLQLSKDDPKWRELIKSTITKDKSLP